MLNRSGKSGHTQQWPEGVMGETVTLSSLTQLREPKPAAIPGICVQPTFCGSSTEVVVFPGCLGTDGIHLSFIFFQLSMTDSSLPVMVSHSRVYISILHVQVRVKFSMYKCDGSRT